MKVIALISGKGGSGKTSVSLALAQMLAILKRRVILVDLDTATHGASYFFESSPPGLEEWVVDHLERRQGNLLASSSIYELKLCVRTVPLDSPFDFLPSKTLYEASDWDVDYVAKHVKEVSTALNKLLDDESFDYVILDCQAGVNVVTAAALELSSHAIIVTEADSVSTKALKNLQNQFAQTLPTLTRAVINKLFLQERSTYDQLTSILRNLEFLPPIPFDMDVRDAFARNVIPLQEQRPTVYFSAILRVIRELFPELYKDIEEMTRNLQRIEFGDYEVELTKLTERKEQLETLRKEYTREIEEARQRTEQIRRLMVPILVMLASSVPLLLNRWAALKSVVSPAVWISLLGLSAGYLWLIYEMVFRKRRKRLAIREDKLQEISAELEDLKTRIDKYNTLYLTERKKLLI